MNASISDKNFIVYKSSAGSGKTFTLVKEYLLLALQDNSNPPQSYKHILAITFTNKAAGEMKERIIKALKELSIDDYSLLSKNASSLLSALKKDSQNLTDELIKERSQRILAAILHNYSDFAIGTIDSFVHKIVRTFAYDLRIPLSFEIETDSEKLLQQSIDLLISKIGNDDALTKALIEYTESKTDDEKSWHIENDLKQFAAQLLNEEGAMHAEKLKNLSIQDFFSIKDELAKQISLFENKIIAEANKAVAIIQKNNISSNDFFHGANGIGTFFKNLAEGSLEKIEPNSYVKKTIEEDKWTGGKTSKETQAAIENIKHELTNIFKKIEVIKEKEYAKYVLFILINKNIYSLAVLNEIEKLITEYKTENNIVHISDFNKKIAEIVLTQPVPYIYERLGERYKNYLIDEFQDTSVLQFQNLLPLIDNSLSENHFTMLVGDGKQAIYRWRGGDVEQFDSLPEIKSTFKNDIVKEREESLKRNYNPKYLYKNYRSKREIIEFNNSFFRTIADSLNEKQKKIYDGLEQEFAPENTGGYIHLEFLNPVNKQENEEKNLVRIIEIINELTNSGYSYSDIAILVGKNKEGSLIANHLSKFNIPLISSDSLLLENSEEIRFVIALLKYLQHPENDIIQIEIIEHLINNSTINETELERCIKEKNETGFISFLKNKGLNFNEQYLSKMPLYELCEHIIKLFRLNEKPNAYMQFFLDEIHHYTSKRNNNLSEFLEYWGDKKEKASVVLPKGINAVNIMTIHRSKGLEFPVVILPFLNSSVQKNQKSMWIDLDSQEIQPLSAAIVNHSKELTKTQHEQEYENEKNKTILDSLNVLYVALTRPEQQMYILTGKLKEDQKEFTDISDFFSYYLKATEKLEQNNFVYTIGEKTKKQIQHQTLGTNQTIGSFYSTDWRELIKMRTAAPSIWNTTFAQNKKDYGVMLHTALAKIRYKNEIENALNTMLNDGLIIEEEKEHLHNSIIRIINHPSLQIYFENDFVIKNESEIITPNGKTYRTDRVAIKNNDAAIIDYKTGVKKKEHRKQIDDYASLIREMGYTVINKLLVYISEDDIEVVS